MIAGEEMKYGEIRAMAGSPGPGRARRKECIRMRWAKGENKSKFMKK